jgi:hypothetical protein
VGAIVVLEIPSMNWCGNKITCIGVVNILDGSDLLSSGEVYSGIVQSNPSSHRLAAVEGQQLARDGYMVS